MSDEEVRLDLSKAEDLAVVLAIVPDWPDLLRDLSGTEEDQAEFQRRLQAVFDERVAAKANEARVLRRLIL